MVVLHLLYVQLMGVIGAPRETWVLETLYGQNLVSDLYLCQKKVLPSVIFFWLITARFNPDSRGNSVAHISKVVPFSNENASRDSNTHSHPYGSCSPFTNSTN